ncbi:MAG TPA: DUF721 domain-containing protein [Candidatus Rubrimentiphilum sp.]|nr:DUF721 domain-containing protein [Candidatus Rubrimentiphilum sp.]
MQPLRAALSSWQPAKVVAGDPLSHLRAQWATIVGEDIASNSRPSELVRGSLLVVTRSAAWSQQLSFLSERIVEAVRVSTGVSLEGVRFRVGRIGSRSGPSSRRKAAARKRTAPRPAADTLESAVAMFRADVMSAERAKAGAGWKECNRCGIRIVPSTGSFCAPCANARGAERSAAIARLLFEVPFLGYSGISDHVENLSRDEYERVRSKLLARWWDALMQLQRSERKRASGRERDIVSSYILLKTRLDPEKIAPAVVRDLLGEELYNIFYGSDET